MKTSQSSSRLSNAGRGLGFNLEQLEQRVLLSAGLGNPNNTVVAFDTTNGVIEVELFDDIASATVQNFLRYVTSNRYDDTLIHRSVDDFVIQGGGFTYTASEGSLPITTFGTIDDEPLLPSVAGTLSMAKTSAPDSATSQWFFNVTDNFALDNPDPSDPISGGGFTVFGAIRNSASFTVVNAINDLMTQAFASPFNELPVQASYDPSVVPVPESSLVFVDDVRILGTVGSLSEGITPATTSQPTALFENGQLSVDLLNESGQIVRYISSDNGATWIASSGSTFAGSSTTGETAGWRASNGDRFTAQIEDGSIRVTRSVGGSLTTVSLGNGTLRGDVFAIEGTDGVVTLLAYEDASGSNGDLILYTQNGSIDADGDPLWTSRNLTVDDLSVFSEATPDFTGEVISVSTSWNARIVAGVDSSGDLQAVWFANGLPQNKFRVTNLSAVSGADTIVGGLSFFETAWGGLSFTGVNASGELISIWWAPGLGGSWIASNFSDLFSFPAIETDKVGAFSIDNQLNIVGVDATSGDFVLFTWIPTRLPDAWVREIAIASTAPSFQAPVTDLRPVVDDNGDVSVFTVTATGDLLRFAWDVSDDSWTLGVVTPSSFV